MVSGRLVRRCCLDANF